MRQGGARAARAPRAPRARPACCAPSARHVTAISHVRRLLESDFARNKICETPAHFRQRMQRVEDHMNLEAFAAEDGTGLLGLCKQLRSRCQALIDGVGERLPY